jgi:kynureninase
VTTRDDCQALDRADLLLPLRDRFIIPPGVIYLDGNSLGLCPKAVQARVQKAVTEEWARDLITSWNKHGWFELPQVAGNKLARLIGAAADSVVVADTISINLFKVLTAALGMRRERKVILSDNGNFPSDLYVAQGLSAFLHGQYEVRVVAPEDVAAAITPEVAVVMITEVDYRTARKHDMAAITAQAHANGALIIWDLAHSAGAFPVNLMGANADFAIGCTYKYINGGPGSQAFIFVHPRNQALAMPALVGWWGHSQPFAFALDYDAAPDMRRMQSGTQAIVSLAALDAALDCWADVDMEVLKEKSQSLCQLFILLVEEQCGAFGLALAGPRDMAQRGSHVSFHHPHGYAVMQALIARGVIGDFRAPDMVRFGFAALYNSHTEVFDAASILADILRRDAWNRPEFLQRKAVT